MSADALGVQKRAPDLLELELQVVGSCLAWIQGTECGSSARTVHALNPGAAILLALPLLLLWLLQIVHLPSSHL